MRVTCICFQAGSSRHTSALTTRSTTQPTSAVGDTMSKPIPDPANLKSRPKGNILLNFVNHIILWIYKEMGFAKLVPFKVFLKVKLKWVTPKVLKVVPVAPKNFIFFYLCHIPVNLAFQKLCIYQQKHYKNVVKVYIVKFQKGCTNIPTIYRRLYVYYIYVTTYVKKK